jgi:DNA topoisomerase-3
VPLPPFQDCGSQLLALDWKKGHSPLEGGATQRSGCVVCDEALAALCEIKHAKAFVKRAGRGGRGRGRGRGRCAAGPCIQRPRQTVDLQA